MSLNIPQSELKRIVLAGGGFAGISLLKELKNSNYQVVLLDRNNYHLFKPLLYQVATAELDEGDISFPFRKMIGGWDNFYFRLADVESVDVSQSKVYTSEGVLDYDFFVVATGSIPNFYGLDFKDNVPLTLSSLEDVNLIRQRILRNMEKVLVTDNQTERKAILNIVVAGGGATGVEVAGALSEMKNYILAREYKEIDKGLINIYLVESGSRLLSNMSVEISEKCQKELAGKGVKVILEYTVADVLKDRVIFNDGSCILCENVIWTCGVKSEHMAGINDMVNERAGRINVDQYGAVKGYSNVFAIGDISITYDKNYPSGYSQLASTAIAQGKRLGKNLVRRSLGMPMKPYVYKPLWKMVTVGRNVAFIEGSRFHIGGFVAWVTWSLLHIAKLTGIRNRISAFIGWLFNYFGRDIPHRIIRNNEIAPKNNSKVVSESNQTVEIKG